MLAYRFTETRQRDESKKNQYQIKYIVHDNIRTTFQCQTSFANIDGKVTLKIDITHIMNT